MWSNEQAEQEVVAFVDPDQWVRVDKAEEQVVIYDSWEQWEEARRNCGFDNGSGALVTSSS